MCTGAEIAAVASLISAGSGVAAAQAAKKNKPKPVQDAKKPDAGLTDDERRSKLLAQLAAGAARNNPTGGLAGSPTTGSLTLGG